mmetsp:Transcript_57614/g.126225  ORF Transcript_57614/g.126225 Transcript_57614/m.126225 type:complete len:198 (-) Transcript_57614:79-672(-)
MLIGREAPDFRAPACMPDDSFTDLSLSDYRGKKYVILYFYALDFMFVEASEIVAFSDRQPEFEKKDCQVLGVSVDSHYAHRTWRNMPKGNGGIEKVHHPLISDLGKEISRAYDVLFEDTHNQVACRGVFLIDKNGVVQCEVRNNLALGRNIEEVLRCVDALQHHESTGKVCPANWAVGRPDMTPTAEGVAEYMKQLV